MERFSLVDVFECGGYLDFKFFNEMLEDAANFDICVDDVREDIKNYCGNVLDVNSWIYSCINLMFYRVVEQLKELTEDEENEEIKEAIQDKLQEWEDGFSPFINCLDSWFNVEELDDFRNEIYINLEKIYNSIKADVMAEVVGAASDI